MRFVFQAPIADIFRGKAVQLVQHSDEGFPLVKPNYSARWQSPRTLNHSIDSSTFLRYLFDMMINPRSNTCIRSYTL